MAMIPFADMFNHKPKSSAEAFWYYDDDRKGFVVRAGRDVAEGKEVCISYGEQKGNLEFFMSYGFLQLANQQHDYMFLQLKLDPMYPILIAKALKLQQTWHN